MRQSYRVPHSSGNVYSTIVTSSAQQSRWCCGEVAPHSGLLASLFLASYILHTFGNKIESTEGLYQRGDPYGAWRLACATGRPDARGGAHPAGGRRGARRPAGTARRTPANDDVRRRVLMFVSFGFGFAGFAGCPQHLRGWNFSRKIIFCHFLPLPSSQ